MTYPVPTQTDGLTVNDTHWNAHVNALNDLNTRTQTVETRTTDTTTNGGHGNTRLSDRLGTGVGTGTNTTTGNAAAQLGDIRTRIGPGITTASPADTRLATLETTRNTHGRWYLTQGTTYTHTSGNDVPFNTVDGNPISGVSINAAGTITVTNAGRYSLSSLVYGNLSAAGTITLAIIHKSGANTYYRGGNTTVLSSASDFFSQADTKDVTCLAGDTFAINLSRSGTGAITSTTAMMGYRAVNAAIHRIG